MEGTEEVEVEEEEEVGEVVEDEEGTSDLLHSTIRGHRGKAVVCKQEDHPHQDPTMWAP